MAHHKLTVIGKLVSDPKHTDFSNGGRVAKFGLPIDFTRRKKNPTTGEWEGDSFIINVDAFNRDNYKLADLVLQYLKKGSLVYVEGRLKNNEYTDKNGVKIARPVLVADLVEFLEGRGEGAGGMGEGGMRSTAAPAASSARSAPAPAARTNNAYANYDDEADVGAPAAGRPSSAGGGRGGDNEDEIPF